MKLIYTILGIFLLSLSVDAQVPSTKQEWQERYDRNIKKQRLYGVYIPADMDEALEELTALSRPEDLAKFSAAPEDTIAVRLRFGLGRWMSHNWQFEDGSRFSHWLNLKGLSFPDDMVETVIRSFHRKLNKKEIDLDKQVEILITKREKEHEERMKKAKVKVISKRKLDSTEIEALNKQKE